LSRGFFKISAIEKQVTASLRKIRKAKTKTEKALLFGKKGKTARFRAVLKGNFLKKGR